MASEVTLPALGESVTEGTVTRWLKQVGDSVAVDEPLLEVSTDKVDTEIPSPVAGTLQEILVQEDDTVPVGADLALVGGSGSGGGGQAAPEQESVPQQEAPAAEPEPAPDPEVELTEDEPAAEADAADEGGADSREPEVELSPDDVLRADRDEILAPLAKDLGRRAKRALQDEQNELLDQIRTRKGTIAAADVLPALDAQEAAWLEVLEEPLRTAYAKASEDIAIDGRRSGEGELPADLLIELATVMVGAWRERLVAAIDGAAEDPDAITQALGARYREYRGQELDRALGDALAAAWARGAYAAVPDGTMLRWVPAEVGRCPDCDDNALEPTARNEPFPTGQQFPPAHPGFRCFLAVVEPAAVSQ
jgi:pyruvate/2-oxoglutarate dehydrogenase complex dihydrolipoamide acyltransferase (E2) component